MADAIDHKPEQAEEEQTEQTGEASKGHGRSLQPLQKLQKRNIGPGGGETKEATDYIRQSMDEEDRLRAGGSGSLRDSFMEDSAFDAQLEERRLAAEEEEAARKRKWARDRLNCQEDPSAMCERNKDVWAFKHCPPRLREVKLEVRSPSVVQRLIAKGAFGSVVGGQLDEYRPPAPYDQMALLVVRLELTRNGDPYGHAYAFGRVHVDQLQETMPINAALVALDQMAAERVSGEKVVYGTTLVHCDKDTTAGNWPRAVHDDQDLGVFIVPEKGYYPVNRIGDLFIRQMFVTIQGYPIIPIDLYVGGGETPMCSLKISRRAPREAAFAGSSNDPEADLGYRGDLFVLLDITALRRIPDPHENPRCKDPFVTFTLESLLSQSPSSPYIYGMADGFAFEGPMAVGLPPPAGGPLQADAELSDREMHILNSGRRSLWDFLDVCDRMRLRDTRLPLEQAHAFATRVKNGIEGWFATFKPSGDTVATVKSFLKASCRLQGDALASQKEQLHDYLDERQGAYDQARAKLNVHLDAVSSTLTASRKHGVDLLRASLEVYGLNQLPSMPLPAPPQPHRFDVRNYITEQLLERLILPADTVGAPEPVVKGAVAEKDNRGTAQPGPSNEGLAKPIKEPRKTPTPVDIAAASQEKHLHKPEKTTPKPSPKPTPATSKITPGDTPAQAKGKARSSNLTSGELSPVKAVPEEEEVVEVPRESGGVSTSSAKLKSKEVNKVIAKGGTKSTPVAEVKQPESKTVEKVTPGQPSSQGRSVVQGSKKGESVSLIKGRRTLPHNNSGRTQHRISPVGLLEQHMVETSNVHFDPPRKIKPSKSGLEEWTQKLVGGKGLPDLRLAPQGAGDSQSTAQFSNPPRRKPTSTVSKPPSSGGDDTNLDTVDLDPESEEWEKGGAADDADDDIVEVKSEGSIEEDDPPPEDRDDGRRPSSGQDRRVDLGGDRRSEKNRDRPETKENSQRGSREGDRRGSSGRERRDDHDRPETRGSDRREQKDGRRETRDDKERDGDRRGRGPSPNRDRRPPLVYDLDAARRERAARDRVDRERQGHERLGRLDRDRLDRERLDRERARIQEDTLIEERLLREDRLRLERLREERKREEERERGRPSDRRPPADRERGRTRSWDRGRGRCGRSRSRSRGHKVGGSTSPNRNPRRASSERGSKSPPRRKMPTPPPEVENETPKKSAKKGNTPKGDAKVTPPGSAKKGSVSKRKGDSPAVVILDLTKPAKPKTLFQSQLVVSGKKGKLSVSAPRKRKSEQDDDDEEPRRKRRMKNRLLSETLNFSSSSSDDDEKDQPRTKSDGIRVSPNHRLVDTDEEDSDDRDDREPGSGGEQSVQEEHSGGGESEDDMEDDIDDDNEEGDDDDEDRDDNDDNGYDDAEPEELLSASGKAKQKVLAAKIVDTKRYKAIESMKKEPRKEAMNTFMKERTAILWEADIETAQTLRESLPESEVANENSSRATVKAFRRQHQGFVRSLSDPNVVWPKWVKTYGVSAFKDLVKATSLRTDMNSEPCQQVFLANNPDDVFPSTLLKDLHSPFVTRGWRVSQSSGICHFCPFCPQTKSNARSMTSHLIAGHYKCHFICARCKKWDTKRDTSPPIWRDRGSVVSHFKVHHEYKGKARTYDTPACLRVKKST